jgi:quercetin dioxygenase-like cupin family protein
MGNVVRLGELPEKRTPSGRWQQLNAPLGIRAFGVNAVAMEPGDDFDIEHDESADGHQEMYVVVSGRMRFRLGDEEVEAGPGDVVAVPDPAETRNYWAVEPGTRVVCVGAAVAREHPYGEWIDREPES